jgi:hypothetical protein
VARVRVPPARQRGLALLGLIAPGSGPELVAGCYAVLGVASAALVGAGLLAVAAVAVGIGLRSAPAPRR